MSIVKSLEKRRTYYNINKELPVSEDEVIELIQELTELVPDAKEKEDMSKRVKIEK